MSRPRVFVTRMIAREAMDSIAQTTDMEVWANELPPPYDVLMQKARDAEGLLTLLSDRVDAGLLNAASRLKVVSNMAVGYDNIDVAEATRRHIIVGYTPEVLTETTADMTFALMMAAARRVVEADQHTRGGLWKTWGPKIMLGYDIHHATLGIIGLGRIGTEVAKRARGFEMKVFYYDQVRRSEEEERRLGVEYVPRLAKLLPQADFVSVHVPLLPGTHHLLGAPEFALMKPNAVLVNTSRGPIVDQKALYEALKARHIFAAGIDVTEIEPIPRDDPLLTLDNIIITPHIASASFTTRTKMALMAVENLLAGLEGKIPSHCINPGVFK
jgi:glyoxylate reductase